MLIEFTLSAIFEAGTGGGVDVVVVKVLVQLPEAIHLPLPNSLHD